MSGVSIAKSLDLQLLNPVITTEDVLALCNRAANMHLASVCVWPAHVSYAAKELAGTDTRVRAAIGFPYGTDTTKVKMLAADDALKNGANDLLIALNQADLTTLSTSKTSLNEVIAVISHSSWVNLRVGKNSGSLSIALDIASIDLDTTKPLFELLEDSSIEFLQTSSGFNRYAVQDHHIRKLRELLPNEVSIIAAGGVSDIRHAKDLINAGAVRISSSSALTIISSEKQVKVEPS